MLPNRYTEFEGGDWLPWTEGEVSDIALAQRAGDTVVINNVRVHSLVTRSGLRWDCVYGRRRSIRLLDNHVSKGVI